MRVFSRALDLGDLRKTMLLSLKGSLVLIILETLSVSDDEMRLLTMEDWEGIIRVYPALSSRNIGTVRLPNSISFFMLKRADVNMMFLINPPMKTDSDREQLSLLITGLLPDTVAFMGLPSAFSNIPTNRTGKVFVTNTIYEEPRFSYLTMPTLEFPLDMMDKVAFPKHCESYRTPLYQGFERLEFFKFVCPRWAYLFNDISDRGFNRHCMALCPPTRTTVGTAFKTLVDMVTLATVTVCGCRFECDVRPVDVFLTTPLCASDVDQKLTELRANFQVPGLSPDKVNLCDGQTVIVIRDCPVYIMQSLRISELVHLSSHEKMNVFGIPVSSVETDK